MDATNDVALALDASKEEGGAGAAAQGEIAPIFQAVEVLAPVQGLLNPLPI
jgi:hypothetical protein